MKIIEIENNVELTEFIKEYQQFKSDHGLAENSLILVGSYNENKGKFLVVDKSNDLVYEVDKIYVCRYQNTHLLDYKIEYCKIEIE